MLKLLIKYYPLIALGKDVESAVKADTGKDKKPFYMTARFVGAIVALFMGFMSVQFGVTLDADMAKQLTENLEKFITMCGTAYGVVLSLFGSYRAIMKKIGEAKK